MPLCSRGRWRQVAVSLIDTNGGERIKAEVYVVRMMFVLKRVLKKRSFTEAEKGSYREAILRYAFKENTEVVVPALPDYMDPSVPRAHICTKCGGPTPIKRQWIHLGEVRRRRICKDCGEQHVTIEVRRETP